MDANFNKRKATMVLHDLEASLGNFILDTEIDTDNFPEEIVKYIARREQDKDRSLDTTKPRDIIEATYLDELFQILLEITKDTSANIHIERLRRYFILYEVYDIRNIVSHPNRPFIDAYWYKIAALASDPIIDILGMHQVKRSLASAEEGRIIDPPEDWVKKIIWEVPNNLPENFEHAITGLVGRQKEASDLLALIKNPRINNIAIVAPGGIGKTALVLDLLSSQVKLPETKDYFDSCLYATLKTERLTSGGVVKLNSIETLDELKALVKSEAELVFEQGYDSFEHLCRDKEKERVLLFVDNLETLLIDSQAEFHAFNNSLPAAWRLLVTSRVTINNASITSLEPLKPKSAVHLARSYIGRRGGDVLDEVVLTELAKKCHYNPLAIRLTIDLYVSGKEIPNSINVANKEIASFSFSNLIENLSQESVKILEALFVATNSDRNTLCEILSLSTEEVAQGISELSNTSLITRKTTDSGEVYTLSDSIRELVLVNTRNILVRAEIQAQIAKRITLPKQIEANQINQSIPEYHWEYIPKEINANLKVLLVELNKSSKKLQIRNDRAVALHKLFKESEHLYDHFSVFNRGYGRILEALKANELAISKYKKAQEQNPQDPSNRVCMAMLLHKCGSYEAAHAVYRDLTQEGWDEEKDGDKSIAFFVVNGFYLSLLFDHKYDDILEHTKQWKESVTYRGLIGSYRASAWKRKAEAIVNTDSTLTIKYLTSAMKILDDIFTQDGYIKPACAQAKNLFSEIAYCLNNRAYTSSSDFANTALNFIDSHLANTAEQVNYSTDDAVLSLIEKLSKVDISSNPFRGKFWSRIFERKVSGGLDLVEVEAKGLTLTSVTATPRGRNGQGSYMFSVDESREEYFLRQDQLRNGGWSEWSLIGIGDKLAVLPDRASTSGRATEVSDIYIVDPS